MKKKAAIVIGNALVWGVVMIACALALKGTEAFKEIQFILIYGSTASLFIVGLGVIKKSKE